MFFLPLQTEFSTGVLKILKSNLPIRSPIESIQITFETDYTHHKH